MFNAGQQIGGAVGLAVIGSIAWTIVNNHLADSAGRPAYAQVLSSGVTAALGIGACAPAPALLITVVAIRRQGGPILKRLA